MLKKDTEGSERKRSFLVLGHAVTAFLLCCCQDWLYMHSVGEYSCLDRSHKESPLKHLSLQPVSLMSEVPFLEIRYSQVVQWVKNLPGHAVDARDMSSFPGLGRSPGGGNDSPLWYSCLENSMDRGAWRATVYGVAKSRRWLSTCTHASVRN